MPDFDWKMAVADIHAAPILAVIAATGGGSSAIGRLLELPGGSRTLLEALVPYSHSSLEDWLGCEVEQACNPQAARAMAMAAWTRARALAPDNDPQHLVGIGATASLASDRPKRGEHRLHVAVQTGSSTACRSLTLKKGARNRADEERLAADILLGCLAEVAGLPPSPVQQAIEDQLVDYEQIEYEQQLAESEWTQLLLNLCKSTPFDEPPKAVFPGSFNPPHAGHEQMVDHAARELAAPVAYELSITNVDKPTLDFIEIAERINELKQLDGPAQVLLTNAPTFREKAALFPGATFLVGADTIARIVKPQYYEQTDGDPSAEMEVAIAQIADQGCRFLVFGREIDGHFCLLSDLKIPPSLAALCTEVSAEDFREDISSTELRQRELFN